jgi:hypothetical protein
MSKNNERPQSAWNLEAISNPSTRPIEIKEIGDKEMFHKPNGCTSTVYKWTNLDSDMWYVGMHKESGKPYFTSSTNPKFKSDLANPNGSWKFEIIEWGSVKECQQLEHEILLKEDAKKNRMSYNFHNGHPGVEKLRIEKVTSIVNEIDTVRKHKQLDEAEFIDASCVTEGIKANVLVNRQVFQARHRALDTENVLKIQDRIANGIGGTRGYDMPIFLTDVTIGGTFYKKLLFSGNHTIQSYADHPINKFNYTPLLTIDIGPEIHEQFSEQELKMIANDLNADYNVGKPFSKDDAVKECLGHEKSGHSWNTVEMKRRFLNLGLTSNQINKVIDMVYDVISKKKQRAAGMVVINYQKAEGGYLLQDEVDKYDDNTFVMTCASGSPNTDRIMVDYLKHQQLRLDEGKKIQKNIVILVFHTTEYTKRAWKTLRDKINFIHNQSSDLHKQLKSFIKIPKFEFKELEMYMPDIHYKRRLKSLGVENVTNQKTLVDA